MALAVLLCSCMTAAGATAAPTGRAEGTDSLGQAALSDEAGLRAAGHRRRERMERRIVGGTKATGNYKWATMITKIGGASILCTGSIISNRWMVTAAHCILNSQNTGYRNPGSGTEITYGCLDINDGTSCKRVGATRYVAHPCYTPSNDQDHDDVALIELSPPLTDFPQSSYALVNGLNGSVGDLLEHSPLYLAGFGATMPDGSFRASELQEVKVQTVSKEKCIEANPYSHSLNYINFDHVVCTGGVAGKDSCNGDSGGPAIFLKGSEPWLVGVLSKGSQKPTHTANCAVEGRFGMYTLLHLYSAWIYATMHGEAYTCDRCPCTGSALEFMNSALGQQAKEGKGAYVEVILIFKLDAAQFQLGSTGRLNVIKALAKAAGQSPADVYITSAEPARRRQDQYGNGLLNSTGRLHLRRQLLTGEEKDAGESPAKSTKVTRRSAKSVLKSIKVTSHAYEEEDTYMSPRSAKSVLKSTKVTSRIGTSNETMRSELLGRLSEQVITQELAAVNLVVEEVWVTGRTEVTTETNKALVQGLALPALIAVIVGLAAVFVCCACICARVYKRRNTEAAVVATMSPRSTASQSATFSGGGTPRFQCRQEPGHTETETSAETSVIPLPLGTRYPLPTWSPDNSVLPTARSDSSLGMKDLQGLR